MDNEISAVMTATMSKIKEMVDTNTVVGEPITTPDDITLIPLSRVSFAFASGGSEFPMKENKNGVGCGSGAGVKVEPMGFLIVKDGNVRMLNVMPPASNTFDRLIDKETCLLPLLPVDTEFQAVLKSDVLHFTTVQVAVFAA